MAALTAKITQVGNSLGVVLTKEMLDKLHVKKGDVLSFIETEQGFTVTAYNEDVSEELALASEVMSQYRHTLRELAK
jgi:putative addiction module antidote